MKEPNNAEKLAGKLIDEHFNVVNFIELGIDKETYMRLVVLNVIKECDNTIDLLRDISNKMSIMTIGYGDVKKDLNTYIEAKRILQETKILKQTK